MMTRENYPKARRSSLPVKRTVEHHAPGSGVAIVSSNFASVANIYQIHPDMSITKSYFRNIALAVMRFESAERRDQNT